MHDASMQRTLTSDLLHHYQEAGQAECYGVKDYVTCRMLDRSEAHAYKGQLAHPAWATTTGEAGKQATGISKLHQHDVK